MPTKRATTMQQVADEAGVSKMSVSAVLSGNSEHVRVSEATRERILQVASRLRYRPNAVARSLRKRRTNIIGLYSGWAYLDARNLFEAEIIGGIQEGCDQHRMDLLLHGVFRGRSVDDIYTQLVDGRIDGLIIVAPPEDPLVHMLAESHLPVVAITDAIPTLPSVVVDDDGGAEMLLEFLAERGHQHVLYRGWDRRAISVMRRHTAFLRVAERLDLETSEWIAGESSDPRDASLLAWLTLPDGKRPTAVCCWNDMAAFDLLAHCRTHGVRVPEDLAITGFDGVPTIGVARRLTTIRAGWPSVARSAVHLLVDRLDGRDVPRETVLPVQLVQGDTA
ncbi:MAG: LacI family DNA-binding transcriptional regulator [Armatimonadetes bacterium]|nr:LacI family DNA-binding transcriptional regulator [Armatimonadota bacterium]MDE2206975.1 LacI family DNA-binding transcriptional regulator [Armatimonadota bacterium]